MKLRSVNHFQARSRSSITITKLPSSRDRSISKKRRVHETSIPSPQFQDAASPEIDLKTPRPHVISVSTPKIPSNTVRVQSSFTTTPINPPKFRSESADHHFTRKSTPIQRLRISERGDDLVVKGGQLYCTSCQCVVDTKKSACDAHFRSSRHQDIKLRRANQMKLGSE